ncbi:MAG: hypothetical protein R3B54_07020 [Bdellovibrionota bacterium]
MRNAFVGLLLLGLMGVALPEAIASEGEFAIEDGLVDKIYRETLQAETEEKTEKNIRFGINLSLLNAGKWTLKNNYFRTDYADNVDLFGSLEVSASLTLTQLGKFQLLGEARGGYGFQTGVFRFESNEGETRTDNVQLHRVPLSLEARVQFHQPGIPVRPFLGGGLGVQWSYQVGTLDGVHPRFLVPYAFFRPGLVLFAPDSASVSWFGGVKVSGLLMGSFASEQILSGKGVEFGIDLIL